MKILDFNELLKDSILMADGAMGSLLHESVGAQRCFDELNRRTSMPARRLSKQIRLARTASSSRHSVSAKKSSGSTAAASRSHAKPANPPHEKS
jgi:hypothetical protein